MTTYRYEVVELDRRSIAGDHLWTVIQHVDDVCKGGDHHWVRDRYAYRALTLYESGYHDLHGAPPGDLAQVWDAEFGSAMFDNDC